MDLNELIEKLYSSESFQGCFAKAAAGKHFAVTGVIGSAVSFLVSGIAVQGGGQLIVITADSKTSELLQDDLEALALENFGDPDGHLLGVPGP